MIKSFRDKDTEAFFKREKCHRKWRAFARVALRKLVMLHAAKVLKDLTRPPKNCLEALKGNRPGQHAIRINDQYRVCFEWKDGDAYSVEITDYH